MEARDYQLKILNETDNPTYFVRAEVGEVSSEDQKSLDYIENVLENDILYPQYVNNYLICDSYYLTYRLNNYVFFYNNNEEFPTTIEDLFVWQINIMDLSSVNSAGSNAHIIVKYPLINIIAIELMPFFLPYYFVWDPENASSGLPYGSWVRKYAPPGGRIFITVAELVERYSMSKNSANLGTETLSTLPAVITKDALTYDGTNNSGMSYVEPANNGRITFRFILQELTALSFSFNDGHSIMILPNPLIPTTSMRRGNPSSFRINFDKSPQGSLLENNELIIIQDVVATDPIADEAAIAQITRRSGWLSIVYAFMPHTVDIAFDSSGMVGFITSAVIYVPARRLTIPINVIQQKI